MLATRLVQGHLLEMGRMVHMHDVMRRHLRCGMHRQAEARRKSGDDQQPKKKCKSTHVTVIAAFRAAVT